MATISTNTVIDNATDASFRTWITEFDTMLLATGLVNTSDTGQLNLATAIRPAISTSAGYRIYRFDDTLQGTAPIFLKVEFGSGSGSVAVPSVWLTVGAATNGAGTIVAGATTTRVQACKNNAPASAVTPYTSRACAVEGCAWISFKMASTGGNGVSGFLIARSCDGDGVPTDLGFIVYYLVPSSGVIAAQQVLYTGPVVSAQTAAFCLIPMGVNTGVVGSDLQYRKHYMATPRDRCNPFLFTIHTSDVAEHTERVLTPLAGVSHNYVSLGIAMGSTAGVGATTSHGVMTVWE